MKTSIIFFLIFMTSISIKAEESYQLHLFTYDQNGKVMGIREIKYQQNKLIVDGLELSSLEATVKSKFLNSIFKKKFISKSYNCTSGKFILRISKAQKDMIEDGCLDSKRYFDLVEAFEKMKKDVVLK